MIFETYIKECMAKLDEQVVQGQAAQPAQTAQLGQQPAVTPPAQSAQPQATQPAQAGTDLKPRKDALKGKLDQKLKELQGVIAKIDTMDANAMVELEKTIQ